MRTVLVTNLGMPRAATADCVAAFLREIHADPLVADYPRWLWKPLRERSLAARVEQLAQICRGVLDDEIGCDRGTEAVASALQAAVGIAASVRPVHRYGEPSLMGELRSAFATPGDVTVLPLYPQRMSCTSETIAQTSSRVAVECRAADRLEILRIAPDDPAYVLALAQRTLAAQGRAYLAPEHFVFSFHGSSRGSDRRERSGYRADCELTARAVADMLGIPAAHSTTCFQSRFGRETAVGPSLCSALRELGRKGVKSVAVVTPGFLTDGLETREEARTRGRRVFLEAGGKDYVVTKAVEAHPVFIDSLAHRIAPEAFQPVPQRTAHAG